MNSATADTGMAVPRLAADVTSERAADGALRLSVPLHRRGPHRWIARVVGLADRTTVELDAVGAWAVEHFDGRTLDVMAEGLARAFKLGRREARVALGQFVQSLIARRIAVLASGPTS